MGQGQGEESIIHYSLLSTVFSLSLKFCQKPSPNNLRRKEKINSACYSSFYHVEIARRSRYWYDKIFCKMLATNTWNSVVYYKTGGVRNVDKNLFVSTTNFCLV